MGLERSDVCKRCGNGRATLGHEIWECGANSNSGNQWVIESQHLCRKALAALAENPNHSFWLRGIVPTAWVEVEEPRQELEQCRVWTFSGSDSQTAGEVNSYSRPRREARLVFLDGALSTSDRRTRRGGWGVVLLTASEVEDYQDAQLDQAWFGEIDGEQTAPCAELAALYWGLKLTEGDTMFVSDCALVVNGFCSEKHRRPEGKQRMWWERVQQAIEARSGSVRLVKCYSHLDARGLLETQQPLLFYLGNELADLAAGLGAKEAGSCLATRVLEIGQLDALTTVVQRRIAAVVCDACEADRAVGDEEYARAIRRDTTSRVLQMEVSSGHLLSRVGRSRRWACSNCGQGPGRGAVVDWLRDNKCPGRVHPPAKNQTIWVPKPSTGQVKVGNRTIHPTHTVMTRDGLYWCVKCGSFGRERIRRLAAECQEKATGFGRRSLERLAKGLYPEAKRQKKIESDVTLQQVVHLLEPQSRDGGRACKRGWQREPNRRKSKRRNLAEGLGGCLP